MPDEVYRPRGYITVTLAFTLEVDLDGETSARSAGSGLNEKLHDNLKLLFADRDVHVGPVDGDYDAGSLIGLVNATLSTGIEAFGFVLSVVQAHGVLKGVLASAAEKQFGKPVRTSSYRQYIDTAPPYVAQNAPVPPSPPSAVVSPSAMSAAPVQSNSATPVSPLRPWHLVVIGALILGNMILGALKYFEDQGSDAETRALLERVALHAETAPREESSSIEIVFVTPPRSGQREFSCRRLTEQQASHVLLRCE